jgi:hypothetical protein
MSSLPSPVAEATHHRASTLSTYFLTRIVIAVFLTGMDIFVFLKSALEGLRNSISMPALHWLLILAVLGIAVSLAHVWYKTLLYRRPSKPNSHNPFL